MQNKDSKIKAFRKKVWSYYEKEGRHDLPWRKTHDPYKILVSEMMLQQTQVDRIVPKYLAFLKRFPTVRSLAEAPLSEVLALWSGLGYNRRALFLKRAAEAVVADRKGKFPMDAETLETLPGVGPYTARAVATFSYDIPYTFIETNIRSVFIREFFPRSSAVPDAALVPLIEAALDAKCPRQWYYALMDYGAHMKKTMPNPSRKSAHYAKQSAFKGSLRQLRGAILRLCTEKKRIAEKAILASEGKENSVRMKSALSSLVAEGFLEIDDRGYVTIK